MGYKIISSISSEKDASVLPGVKWCSTVRMEYFESCCKSMEELFPINCESVPEDEKRQHYEVLATHANCVSRGPMDLGTAKGVQHTIDTGSAQPIRQQVDEMLEAGTIEPSESP